MEKEKNDAREENTTRQTFRRLVNGDGCDATRRNSETRLTRSNCSPDRNPRPSAARFDNNYEFEIINLHESAYLPAPIIQDTGLLRELALVACQPDARASNPKFSRRMDRGASHRSMYIIRTAIPSEAMRIEDLTR